MEIEISVYNIDIHWYMIYNIMELSNDVLQCWGINLDKLIKSNFKVKN
jgi:hypothetical protein